jgi:hypothetical protein
MSLKALQRSQYQRSRGQFKRHSLELVYTTFEVESKIMLVIWMYQYVERGVP